MLYFDDYESLKASLDPADLLSVINAMILYAKDGTTPDDSTLSPVAMVCWRFLRVKIDRDAARYKKKAESNRAAANKRWNANDANRANDANACKCTDSMQMQNSMPTITVEVEVDETVTEPVSVTEAVAVNDNPLSTPAAIIPFPDADDGHDLTDQIEAHQHADDLIRRYQLPDADPTREALLEDAERAGWQALEDALKKAALANSRQRISVAYYRSILNPSTTKGGRYAGAADPYEGYVTF